MRFRSVLFAALVAAIVLPVSNARAGAEEKCLKKELEATGLVAKQMLKCHATAAAAGDPVANKCLKRARKQYNADVDKALDGGTCLAALDDRAARNDADRLATQLSRVLVTKPKKKDACAAKKLKAAGGRAKSLLDLHGAFAKSEDRDAFVADFAKADGKLTKKFGKLEAKLSCRTTSDADAVAGIVDGFADFAMASFRLVDQETLEVASAAEPDETPGSPGVDATDYPVLQTQFGSTDVDLNKATYTRLFYRSGLNRPDAVLVLVPGFLGGALGFKALAENLITRALENGLLLEVWAFDRRGHQLEDRVGLDVAEASLDPQVAVDWLFGEQLGLDLHPDLVAGPNRRAVFYGPQADAAFMANWTPLVFSHDIDAVVETARSWALNDNVFLGGHSAGTGFTARYASTDFDLSGAGPADPGFAKLRGLVLLEGGGGSTAGDPPTEDELDRIEDRADGGLFFAIRDNPQGTGAGRCVDGTACTVDSEEDDCEGLGNETCTEPTTAFTSILGLFGPQLLAAAEAPAIQAVTDLNEGPAILIQPQGDDPDNYPVAVVPEISIFNPFPDGTVAAFAGNFLDDDGFLLSLSSPAFPLDFLKGSLGFPGPVVDGLQTWQSIVDGPLPDDAFEDHGPPPTELPADVWGVEQEVIRVDRFLGSFFVGGSNFTDWYFPSGGLSTTSGLGLDSTALSVDRDRRDIENLTQAANIDIPVIAFGGSNGLTPVSGNFTGFAESIGACTAATCDGTPRVVDADTPNEAFPTFGGVEGGFEVHITEGMAHFDVLGPEDDGSTEIYVPLVEFLLRNIE